MSALSDIQAKLSVPKTRQNTFGNYPYRSASDILESLKPLLRESGCSVVLSDEVRYIEGRWYVVAEAAIYGPNGVCGKAHGWAREEDAKKGYDAAQLTGSCSSYARKYALCGLFAIDDSSSDPDAQESAPDAGAGVPPVRQKPLVQDGNELWAKAVDFCVEKGLKAADLRKWYEISDRDVRKMQEILDFRKELNDGKQ